MPKFSRRLKPSNFESASRASMEIILNLRSIPFILLHGGEKNKEDLKKALKDALREMDKDNINISSEDLVFF
jgi:ethanolamine utilization protein EutA (predicted chaperonin)